MDAKSMLELDYAEASIVLWVSVVPVRVHIP